jgi:hypothetical protein
MNTKLDFLGRAKPQEFLDLEKLDLVKISRRELYNVYNIAGDLYQLAYGAYTINRVGDLLIQIEKRYYGSQI